MFVVKEIKLVYIVTEGNGLAKIDLQKELDRMYFSLIAHVKVGARLQGEPFSKSSVLFLGSVGFRQ